MGGCCSKQPQTIQSIQPTIHLAPQPSPLPGNTPPVDFAKQSSPQWADGARYSGEFRDGLRHGRGTFEWDDGCRYEGEWAQDARHGCGTFVSAHGDAYDGEFELDEMHGRGELRWAGGDIYRGQFRRGHRDGDGEFVWAATGDCYSGERFRKSARRCVARLAANCSSLPARASPPLSTEGLRAGQWQDGRRHGRGRLVCAGGDEVYEVSAPSRRSALGRGCRMRTARILDPRRLCG